MRKRNWPYLLVLLLGLSACLKESIEDLSKVNTIAINPEAIVPLINASVSLKDAYNQNSNKGFLQEDNTGFLTLLFEKRDSLQSGSLINIPKVDLQYDLQMDQGAAAQFEAIGKFSNTFSNYAVIKMNNQERIKGYKIRRGDFIVNIRSEFKHDAVIVFFYPSITKGGISLVDTVRLKYNGISPINMERIVNLDGYDVDMSDGGISYNVVPYMFEINLTRNPSQPVSTTDKITIREVFDVKEYSSLIGYLGKFDIFTSTESQQLDIFDKQIDGNVFLNDPKIIIDLSNGMGVPITGRIANLRVITAKGQEIPVRIEKFKDTFSLPYPTSFGQIVKGEYIIDKTNSNIDSVFSTAPQYVLYDVTFTANYLEQQSEDNFLIWDNEFKYIGNITIPMDLKVLRYTVQSTSEMEPLGNENPSIDYMRLHTHSTNMLPFNAYVQILFGETLNINGIDTMLVRDSLYDDEIELRGAIVDAHGNILSVGVYQNVKEVSRERIARIGHYNKYIVRVRFKTSESTAGSSPFVKLYSNQMIHVKVGMEGKVKYKIEVGG